MSSTRLDVNPLRSSRRLMTSMEKTRSSMEVARAPTTLHWISRPFSIDPFAVVVIGELAGDLDRALSCGLGVPRLSTGLKRAAVPSK